MSTTITKRAEELRRGDVITDFLRAASFLGNAVVVNSYSCGSVGVCDVAGNVTRIMLGYDTGVLVEAPTLTPAQQHAEELLEAARRAAQIVPHSDYHADLKDVARALLAKIDPPAPPTLEEALQALATILDSTSPQKDYEAAKAAQQIVDRARRAKIIP